MKATSRMSNVIADLANSKRTTVFLNRLFAVPAGEWALLAELVEGFDEIEEELEKAYRKVPKLKWVDVVWLPYEPYGPGYVLLLFFCEAIYWKNIVIYNKAHYERQQSKSNDNQQSVPTVDSSPPI